MLGGDFDDCGGMPLVLQTTRRALYKHRIVRRIVDHIRTRRSILHLPLKRDPVSDESAGVFRVQLPVNVRQQSQAEPTAVKIARQRCGEPVNRDSIIFPQRVERFTQPLVELVVVDGGPGCLRRVCVDMDVRALRWMSWILHWRLNLNVRHLIQTFFQKVFIWIEFAILSRWTRGGKSEHTVGEGDSTYACSAGSQMYFQSQLSWSPDLDLELSLGFGCGCGTRSHAASLAEASGRKGVAKLELDTTKVSRSWFKVKIQTDLDEWNGVDEDRSDPPRVGC